MRDQTGSRPSGGAELPASARRTRLLWLIDSLNMGGAESLVVPFLRSFDRERYDVLVACLTAINGNPIEREVMEAGVPFVNLEARNLRDRHAFRRLLQLIRKERIDLIHAHLTYASIWGAIASRLTDVRSIASLHVAPPVHGVAMVRDWLMRQLLQRWSRRVVAVSDSLRNDYLARGGIEGSRLVAIHNGIEIEPFRGHRESARDLMHRELGIPPEAVVVATVAVLRPGKGIEILIEAIGPLLEHDPRLRLLIVGDGPKAAEWKAIADSLPGAERIIWGGYRRDIHAILPGCDLFVHPTLKDAFPTVLLEAMAAGLPIVASNVGGVPEIVSDGNTGLLVPPGDAPSLRMAIESMLRDASQRKSMGLRAAEVAASRFSTSAWVNRLSQLYEQVMKEPK